MLDIKDIRLQLVRPTLQSCKLWSRAAENLMIGTGLIESEFTFLKQFKGPALSFWQVEPNTYNWLIAKLSNDKDLMLRVLRYLGFATLPVDPNQLINNLALACIIARLKYWYNPTPLPLADDIPKMAKYWGKIYQTKSNLKDMKRFVDLYDEYGHHNLD